MLLVDTSVWIDFLSRPGSPAARHLTTLIDEGRPLCINAVVQMEILMGVRSNKDLETLKKLLVPYQYFPDFNGNYFELASEIYRTCRRKGRTIRKSNDCLIAANAILDNLIVLHKDRDFNTIASCKNGLTVIDVDV